MKKLSIILTCLLLFGCARVPANPPDAPENAIAAEERVGEKTSPSALNFPFGGYVTDDGAFLYFVNVNQNTDPDTWEITKIGNDKNAVPEVLYSYVTEWEDGMSASQLCFLFAAEEKVFFIECDALGDGLLKWVSKDGSACGTVDCMLNPLKLRKQALRQKTDLEWHEAAGYAATRYYTDGHYLYYYQPLGGSFYQFDPATETEREYPGALFVNPGEELAPVGFYDGNVYYTKTVFTLNEDGTVNWNGGWTTYAGLFCSALDRADEKELTSLGEEVELNDGFVFSAGYMYYMDGDMLTSYELATGKTCSVTRYDFEYFKDAYIPLNDVVYFFEQGDLCAVSPTEENKRILIRNAYDQDQKRNMQLGGDWILYSTSDKLNYFRVALDGKIFPPTPICGKSRD